MNTERNIRTITILLTILMVLGLTACTKESKNTIDTYGLPKYDKGTYQLIGENEFNILGTTKEDFVSYVNLMKQDGYIYNGDRLDCSEELAIKRDFWTGKKDDSVVSIFLMLDLKTNTNYITVYHKLDD